MTRKQALTETIEAKPRERDPFALARSIYGRRRSLLAKAELILGEADDRVAGLVHAMEAADAKLDETPELDEDTGPASE